MEHILLALAGFIKGVISSLGYPGIAFLMAVESACVPLPSEVIMPFAGYLVYARQFSSLAMVATLGAIGCNLGSVLAYEVGAHGGRPLIERWGKYILMSRHDLDASELFFEKYGSITVFIGRLLPVVRTFIALPAGVSRMKLVPFTIYTLLGSYMWCLALAYGGMKLGQHWKDLAPYFHRFDTLIAIVLIVACAAVIYNRVKGMATASPSGT
jgi:membrane protein DedA with SNARE-associated domain